MRKLILATMVPALLAAGSVNSAELYKGEDGSVLNMYGRIEANFKNAKDEADDRETKGSVYARMGFNGRQVVNEDMAVIGQAQYQLSQKDASSDVEWSARYVWAGLDMSEAGRVEAGRVASGLIKFTDIGDIFYAGGDVVAGAHTGLVDTSSALVFRQDGTLQYRNSLGDLDFSAAYITNSSVDYAYNAAVRYNVDMGNAGVLRPVAMYQQDKADDSTTTVQDYKTYGLGAQYFIGSLYLGATYVEEKMDLLSSADAKTKGTDIVAAYDFGQFVARAGYRYQKFDDMGEFAKTQDRWTVEGQYKLTSMSSLFANYSYNNGYGNAKVVGSGLETTTKKEGGVAQVGIRYQW